jgi:hypothetical protein
MHRLETVPYTLAPYSTGSASTTYWELEVEQQVVLLFCGRLLKLLPDLDEVLQDKRQRSETSTCHDVAASTKGYRLQCKLAQLSWGALCTLWAAAVGAQPAWSRHATADADRKSAPQKSPQDDKCTAHSAVEDMD